MSKGGRPTKYSPKMLAAARKYISACEDEDVQAVRQANAEKGYEMYENKLKVNLPTIEGLATHLDVNRDTLYAWAKEEVEFSDILEALKEKQAGRLINNGLSGDYNPTITKLLLSKHGYVDKTEHTGEGGGPIAFTGLEKLTDEQLDGIVKKLQNSVGQGVDGKGQADSAQSAEVRQTAP
jgi:DNA-packaging protein gp3